MARRADASVQEKTNRALHEHIATLKAQKEELSDTIAEQHQKAERAAADALELKKRIQELNDETSRLHSQNSELHGALDELRREKGVEQTRAEQASKHVDEMKHMLTKGALSSAVCVQLTARDQPTATARQSRCR